MGSRSHHAARLPGMRNQGSPGEVGGDHTPDCHSARLRASADQAKSGAGRGRVPRRRASAPLAGICPPGRPDQQRRGEGDERQENVSTTLVQEMGLIGAGAGPRSDSSVIWLLVSASTILGRAFQVVKRASVRDGGEPANTHRAMATDPTWSEETTAAARLTAWCEEVPREERASRKAPTSIKIADRRRDMGLAFQEMSVQGMARDFEKIDK